MLNPHWSAEMWDSLLGYTHLFVINMSLYIIGSLVKSLFIGRRSTFVGPQSSAELKPNFFWSRRLTLKNHHSISRWAFFFLYFLFCWYLEPTSPYYTCEREKHNDQRFVLLLYLACLTKRHLSDLWMVMICE